MGPKKRMSSCSGAMYRIVSGLRMSYQSPLNAPAIPKSPRRGWPSGVIRMLLYTHEASEGELIHFFALPTRVILPCKTSNP